MIDFTPALSRAYDRQLASESANGEAWERATERVLCTPDLTTEWLYQQSVADVVVELHPAFGYRRVIGSDTDDRLRERMRSMESPELLTLCFRHPHWAEAAMEVLRDRFVTEYAGSISSVAIQLRA
jgi:hypothetical protein